MGIFQDIDFDSPLDPEEEKKKEEQEDEVVEMTATKHTQNRKQSREAKQAMNSLKEEDLKF